MPLPEKTIDLCGMWRFQPDPMEEGGLAGYSNHEFDARLWRECFLPCCFDHMGPQWETYEGTVWFRRAVEIPYSWREQRVILRGKGAACHLKAWVNGREAGQMDDAFLPYEMAVHHLLEPGTKNIIILRVDNHRRPEDAPGRKRGWRVFGGVLREIELAATDFLRIGETRITAEPADGAGQFTLQAVLINEKQDPARAELRVSLLDPDNRTAKDFPGKKHTVPPKGKKKIRLKSRLKPAELWSPDSPRLYTALLELRAGGQIIEEKRVRCGFRKIEVKDGKLLLNGRPVFLTGFNRHEDSPARGMAADTGTARRDFTEMKEAGANFVRLCHYPHHPGELDLCDELGLLAMDEIPLYWWGDYEDGEAKKHNRAKLAAAQRQLTAMIRRDINHPSLIFWSVSNETNEDRPEIVSGNARLVRLARKLDPGRLAVHVSDRWQPEARFAEDDVICLNAYPSQFRRSHSPAGFKMEDSALFWRKALAKVHEQYPDKPVLITEFGHPCFSGTSGNGFGEDNQAAVIEAEFAGMAAPYVSGAAIWCWADHAWPPAHFDFCRSVAVSPYGVLTRARRKKQAYHTARRLFREKQKLAEPPPKPPKAGPAGGSLIMIRPHLRDIPEAPFPEGFGIRSMRTDDIGLWTDIQRDAEPYFQITEECFYDQFGDDLAALPRRCFIITDEKGRGAGTISAWYERDFQGQEWGRVHWVATRPAYQGKGLGKAGLSYVLNRLAQWHDKAFLSTQVKRLPAIRLYLNFGFQPRIPAPEDRKAWKSVRARLSHPLLDAALESD